jgi:hypothetical protein
MPSGGARARSGPPPDPNALRRDRDGADWITLPAEGRDGPTPEWPLSRRTKRETVVWEREWRRPQAVEWERNHQQDEVALYVRALVAAEKLNASVAQRNLVRQLQEALGISLPGMARNRWRIADKQADEKPRPAKKGGTRDRFKVVDGGRA